MHLLQNGGRSMIFIQYEWLAGLPIGNLFSSDSKFVTVKGNRMSHSASSHFHTEELDDYDSFGLIQPSGTTTAETGTWYETDLSTGREKYHSTSTAVTNRWNHLTEGPSSIGWNLSSQMMIADDAVCPYRMDGKWCFSIISSVTQTLLNFLFCSKDFSRTPHTSYYCRPLIQYDLPQNMAIMSGDTIKYESYYWRTNQFVLNGQQATYEDLLRWSLQH